jgi:hypothetical protein
LPSDGGRTRLATADLQRREEVKRASSAADNRRVPDIAIRVLVFVTGLLLIGSGVIGLVARAKLPMETTKWHAVRAIFRLSVGLVALVFVVRG